MQSMTRFRRVTAAASLTALAVSGVAVATTTSAFGEEAGPAGSVSAAPTFPAGTKGELVVHKHKTPAGGATASTGGVQATQAPADPISGVTFTVKKVEGIDLSTNAGWAAAEKLSKDFDASKVTASSTTVSDGTTTYQLGTGTPQTTNSEGVADFKDLDLGLYVVVESDVSGATLGGKKVDVKPAAPFVVSVPMTNPTKLNEWMTTVHVYPKNTPKNDIISKSVQDAGDQLGDDISFTVDTGIDGTDAKAASGITQYIIKDPIVKALAAKQASVKVELIDGSTEKALAAGDGQDWTLTAGEDQDYTVELQAAPDADHSGLLVVTFKDAGLKKLTAAKKANENAKVRLTFDATVTSLPGNGTVTNQAYVFPNGVDASSLSNGEPSNTTESKWGKIEFTKKNSAGTGLQGAEFILTNCTTDTAIPVGVAGQGGARQTVFTSGADGKVQISGIHVSDFVNGAATNDDSEVKYCLKETKAPEGYELLTGTAAEFYVSQLATGEQAAQTFEVAAFQVGGDIVNYPKNGGFNLPLTGAQGLAMAGIAGALLVAGGAVLVVRRRREEEAA